MSISSPVEKRDLWFNKCIFFISKPKRFIKKYGLGVLVAEAEVDVFEVTKDILAELAVAQVPRSIEGVAGHPDSSAAPQPIPT